MSSDAALVAAALDAAHTLDDYIRGVVSIGAGEAGSDVHDGSESKPQAWVRRVLMRTSHGYGQRQVVQGMAAVFAPEQLRKAAVEAVELSSRIDALRSADSEAAKSAADHALELGVGTFAATLSDHSIGSRSPQLHELRRRLGRVLNVLTEARTKLLLEAMRSVPPPDA